MDPFQEQVLKTKQDHQRENLWSVLNSIDGGTWGVSGALPEVFQVRSLEFCTDLESSIAEVYQLH